MRYIATLDSYKVIGNRGAKYLVLVKRLPNDINGNGKAEYTIVPLYDANTSAFVYRGFYSRGGQ